MSVYEDLLNFVPWIKERSGSTISEVAQHFDWTEEQVVQYVLMASITGPGTLPGELLDIHIDGERINVIDTLGLDRPFRFDQIEAACILLGLDVLEQNLGLNQQFAAQDITNLKTKILEVLPQAPVVVAIPTSSEQDVVNQLQYAITNQKQIQFNYWNEARDESELRTVSPIGVKLSGGVLRLNGYCHLREGWRTFNLKRIQDLQTLPEEIAVPDDSFHDMAFTQIDISLPVHLLYQLEAMQVVKRGKIKNARIAATINVLEPSWLARQILASGCQIQVTG
ncbi:MAG: hypothetical protein RL038_1185, partial [Actinomycetota bacterium]